MPRENYNEFFSDDESDQNLDDLKINEVRNEVLQSIDENIHNEQMKKSPRINPKKTLSTKKRRPGFQMYAEQVRSRRSDDSSFSNSVRKDSEDQASYSNKDDEMYFSEEIEGLSNAKQSKKNQKSEKKEKKKQHNKRWSKQQSQQSPVESKEKNQKQRKSGRKIRKTITPALLKELNELFKRYNPDKKCSLQAFDGPPHLFSLKSIGKHLNLGYSTILHKYRQFRAHNEVRGGALIASIDNKRKYRKSIQLESLIQMALKERSFCSAVEMGAYLQSKHSIYLSRSIISRHLVSMGYSFRHHSKSANDEYTRIREMRYQFLKFLSSFIESKKSIVHYLSELEFSIAQSPKDQSQVKQHHKSQRKRQDYSVLALVSFQKGITHYDIKRKYHTQEQSRQFLYDIVTQWQGSGSEKHHIIVMDLKENHRNTQMLNLRQQIRENNIIFAYLPPLSKQLNFADHILSKIEKNTAKLTTQDISNARELLEECLQAYVRPLQNQAEQIKQAFLRAASSQCFSNDEQD